MLKNVLRSVLTAGLLLLAFASASLLANIIMNLVNGVYFYMIMSGLPALSILVSVSFGLLVLIVHMLRK